MVGRKDYYVYIMGNDKLTLYIGVTNDLMRRIWEHRNNFNRRSFVSRYKCYKLLHYEVFGRIQDAISREKNLKNWCRKWKLELIQRQNPTFEDLGKEWV